MAYCILQIKYSFVNYQYSSEQIHARQKILGNPKWRPPPLEVVNVRIILAYMRMYHTSNIILVNSVYSFCLLN